MVRHGLSFCVGACGGLLGISGRKVWGCFWHLYTFVGLSSVVLGLPQLGVVVHLFSSSRNHYNFNTA